MKSFSTPAGSLSHLPPMPEPEPEPKPQVDKVVTLAKAYRVVSGLADIGRFV